jgi:hypothetical protein
LNVDGRQQLLERLDQTRIQFNGLYVDYSNQNEAFKHRLASLKEDFSFENIFQFKLDDQFDLISNGNKNEVC